MSTNKLVGSGAGLALAGVVGYFIWRGLVRGRVSGDSGSFEDAEVSDVGKPYDWATDGYLKRWGLVSSGATGLYGPDRPFKLSDYHPRGVGPDAGFVIPDCSSRLNAGDCGTLYISAVKAGSDSVGASGLWRLPASADIRSISGGGGWNYTQGIVGDPRALALLMVACSIQGTWSWKHLGMYVPPRAGHVNHSHGRSLDLSVLSSDVMNAWVSFFGRNLVPAAWGGGRSGTAPIFQARPPGGAKTDTGAHLKGDHSSHFHIDLPRANGILNLVPLGVLE